MSPRFLFIAFALLLVGCGGQAVEWQKYTEQNFENALHSNRPIILEVYAAWCGPCMKMKYETFRDARVVAALDDFTRIKFDASRRTDPEVRAAVSRFRISGYPTILFFNSGGEELTDLRQSFMSADDLLDFIEYNRNRLFVR